MKQHDFVPLVTFRGWSKEKKHFVYGTLTFAHSQGYWLIQHSDNWAPTYSCPDKGEETVSHIVDSHSLGIYTGEDDKHGDPIFCSVAGAKYGSDIVKMCNGNKSQIRYTRSVFHTGKLDYKFSQIIRPGGLEVIGNQYEQHLSENK